MSAPRAYEGIMVSSTFTDLVEHRRALIEAIEHFDKKPNAMEFSGARSDLDVLDASLTMVRDSAAYVGVISRKYGQVPSSPTRNPDELSITELEFREAMRLNRPIILFIMGSGHSLLERDIEFDDAKRVKLDRFRETAKRMRSEDEIARVYEEFESLEDFKIAATRAVGKLAANLDSRRKKSGRFRHRSTPKASFRRSADEGRSRPGNSLPRPPALASLPQYLGSHEFVGRQAELQRLDDWSAAADPNPVLLFDAMGGSGKSILTWHWLTTRAVRCRSDWAGRFWYSFYEKGAVMSEFVQNALAYISRKPVRSFTNRTPEELSVQLIEQLQARPWLMVLDGLERVLVAYHRYDAAQARDEEIDEATDKIAKRNPCAAIQPQDDELLRRLLVASPSKILISSRITPQALINQSGIPLPGVRREILAGLRPGDAEAMLRQCGVFGTSEDIQAYLQTNCDCHPLVVGALAGLINDFPIDRGNFDEWVSHPQYGGSLNLAELELTQRRNHILVTAIDALAPESRRLLQTFSLLHSGADYETVKSFNPHIPPRPTEVDEPADPSREPGWILASQDVRGAKTRRYKSDLERRAQYRIELNAWKKAANSVDATKNLSATIRDLEARGLLQYERSGRRYDLHPVVRGVTAGRMARDETVELGQQVVDYFTARPHDPWAQAETPEDLEAGLEVVRVLVRMGRFEQAIAAYHGELADAHLQNVDAAAERQALMAPFFPNGWDNDPVDLSPNGEAFAVNAAALALIDEHPESSQKILDRMVERHLKRRDQSNIFVSVRNSIAAIQEMNDLASMSRLSSTLLRFAEATKNPELIFNARLQHFVSKTVTGAYDEAETLWRVIEPSRRDWQRNVYLPGEAEILRAANLFQQQRLNEDFLQKTEELVRSGRHHKGLLSAIAMRGELHLSRKRYDEAATAFLELIKMIRRRASSLESRVILARFLAMEHFDARAEAERLPEPEPEDATAFAELWEALGEKQRAIGLARRAGQWISGSGLPYVQFWEMARTIRIGTGRAVAQRVQRIDRAGFSRR
jgi:tetratricopeptide (TPR) repeat protein